MNRDHALSTLRRHADDLRRLGATRLFLFGSTARDEARSDSDVDVFVDFDDPRFSVVELVALKERIGELLSAPADVTTRRGLHPRLRSEIEGQALQVF